MSGIETCRNFVEEGPQLDKLMTADEKIIITSIISYGSHLDDNLSVVSSSRCELKHVLMTSFCF